MKNFGPSFAIAFKALQVNKLRSVLTMLGIVVGVAAVIAMVALGAGASAELAAQLESLGSNVIVIQPGWNHDRGARGGWGSGTTLTGSDAEAIEQQIPAVLYAAPSVRGNAQIVYGGSNWYSRVEGVTPEYLKVRNFEIESGSPFTLADDQAAAKVAIVGRTVIEEVFGGFNPVGERMRLNNTLFTVVATLKPKGQSPNGEDQDDAILVPLTTARRKLLGRNWAAADSVRNIHVQVRSAELMAQAEAEIASLLRQRHKLQPDEEDDFQVRSLTSRFEAREESMRVMTLLLAAIASVSLLVGGIGIMNIMLVSVTERTREIGLRQAVGAKTGDILSQFLIEAVTLALLGGLAGVALGAGASKLLTAVAGWATLISPAAVLAACVFSALVGVFFGYYPARKAAFLDPIEALRYE
jgi:putative ABC transport system permease protein